MTKGLCVEHHLDGEQRQSDDSCDSRKAMWISSGPAQLSSSYQLRLLKTCHVSLNDLIEHRSEKGRGSALRHIGPADPQTQ